MTPWRIGRGWSDAELRTALASLAGRAVSFADDPTVPIHDRSALPGGPPGEPELAPLPGWAHKRVETWIGSEPPGPPLPDGHFARAREALVSYRFPDPRITHGHFDPRTPLLGRDLLVDVHALMLRYLVGLRIVAVLDDAVAGTGDRDGAEDRARHTRFGIRMDTLAGHLLHGSEWGIVTKDHQRGAIWLHIEARWKQARLPAWWMVPGFWLFGRQTQARWRRQVIRRLRALGGPDARPVV